MSGRNVTGAGWLLLALMVVVLPIQAQSAQRGQDWPVYGGDLGGMKYSPSDTQVKQSPMNPGRFIQLFPQFLTDAPAKPEHRIQSENAQNPSKGNSPSFCLRLPACSRMLTSV